MGSKNWSPEEKNMLLDLVGSCPLPMIAGHLNRKFNNHRTKNAVKIKLNRMGYSVKCEWDYLTQTQWAKELGFPNRYRLSNWVKKGKLKPLKLSQHLSAISIETMKGFADKNPHLFTEVDPEILKYYFGDRICHKIQNTKGITGKPIKVLANGKVYKSIREAERQLKINRTVIAYEMRRPDGWIKRA